MYPSLIFPSFSQAPPIKDSIQYPDVTLYAVSEAHVITQVDKEQFFNGYKKHVNYFLGTIILNENKVKHSSQLKLARAVFIKYAIKQLKTMDPKHTYNKLLIAKTIKYYSTKKLIFTNEIPNGPLTVIDLNK